LSERVGGAENIHNTTPAVTQPNPISRSEIENKRRELLAETLNMHAAMASLLLALITHNHLNKFIWHAAFTLAALIHSDSKAKTNRRLTAKVIFLLTRKFAVLISFFHSFAEWILISAFVPELFNQQSPKLLTSKCLQVRL
jgi:hypothetical protein